MGPFDSETIDQFPQDVSPVIGLPGIINEMVGDIERIQRYPTLGYQVPHELPQDVLDAWTYLIRQGFTHHLMPKASEPASLF
jgi:hypothetical protein